MKKQRPMWRRQKALRATSSCYCGVTLVMIVLANRRGHRAIAYVCPACDGVDPRNQDER